MAAAPKTSQKTTKAVEVEDRSECTVCRGGGKLVSNAGGNPHEVQCAWCGGSGKFQPGRDAQENPSEAYVPAPVSEADETKKPAAKKAAVKKPAAKKAAAKKPAVKKPAAKKAPVKKAADKSK